jgi:hypothetical protein
MVLVLWACHVIMMLMVIRNIITLNKEVGVKNNSFKVNPRSRGDKYWSIAFRVVTGWW